MNALVKCIFASPLWTGIWKGVKQMKQMKHSFKRAMAIMLSILLIKGSKFKSGKVTNAFVGAGKRRKISCSGWISAILYMDFYAVPEG